MVGNARRTTYLLFLATSCFLPVVSVSAQTFEAISIDGAPAPSGQGSFFLFDEPVNNNNNTVVFPATIDEGFSEFSSGLFQRRDDTISVLSRTGDQVPSGGNLRSFPITRHELDLNNNGVVAFEGSQSVSDDPGKVSIFRDTGDKIETIVSQGSPVPPSVGDSNATFQNINNARLNDSGDVFFQGGDVQFQEGDGEFDNLPESSMPSQFNGIFKTDDDTIEPVVTDDTPVPELPGSIAKFSTDFPSFSEFDVNDQGQVAFRADVVIDDSVSGSPGFEEGVYLAEDGDLAQRVVSGDNAGQTGAFVSVGDPSLNNNGEIAFLGRISDTEASGTDQGVFIDRGSVPEKIVSTGEAVPGRPNQDTFGDFETPIINDDGDVVFEATINDGTDFGSEGIFYKPTSGPLRMVIDETDALQTGADTSRNIAFPEIGDFNNEEEVAFTVDFDEGPVEGIYTVDVSETPLVTTPEQFSESDPQLPTSEQEIEGENTTTFVFDVDEVQNPSQTFFIDPPITTGFDFGINGSGVFTSVTAPSQSTVNDPNGFELNVDGETFMLGSGGTINFGDKNLSNIMEFSITDIDPNLGLNPGNPQAFPTGITLNNAGPSTNVTMTPQTRNVPVPGTLGLVGAGLFGLGIVTRPRR